MKLSTTLALTVCAGVVAFVVGKRTQTGPDSEAVVPAKHQTKPFTRVRSGSDSLAAEAAVRAMGKYASCSQEYSARNAAKLTSEERLALLANGAQVGDYGNQAAMLCGLISVLTKEELPKAMEIFENMQAQGNGQAPEVWKSLWQQWGRMDPVSSLGFFGEHSWRSSADARNMMSGWLEINPDAALAWAMEPAKSSLEAAAAALAITRGASGDLKQLESAILKLPADCPTVEASLDDYFDLASLAGTDQTATEVYENLPPALRSAAWSVTAKRIGYENPQKAKIWITEHAADPGRNYNTIYLLFDALSREDPAETVKWAIQLPFSAETDGAHPAASPVWHWIDKDPDSYINWFKTQQPDAPWLPNSGRRK